MSYGSKGNVSGESSDPCLRRHFSFQGKRLQAEVDDLREQLQHARAFARGREKTLLREIAQLRAQSSSSSVLRPTHVGLLHYIYPC